MKTQAVNKPRIKKSTIEINGKKIPYYKIPAGLSGLDQSKVIDEYETEYLDKSKQDKQIAVQQFLETGIVEDSFIEDNFQELNPLYGIEEAQLFDEYE